MSSFRPRLILNAALLRGLKNGENHLETKKKRSRNTLVGVLMRRPCSHLSLTIKTKTGELQYRPKEPALTVVFHTQSERAGGLPSVPSRDPQLLRREQQQRQA